ncbi:Pyrimidine reductase, riboflavin biosynthesis [Bartonella apis]|uniref:dihydrofolate reductase family protein n=1 Tax=Bartonella apis TaxID=1686310 RepID=UPI000963A425|nr:dihydrofolate reductase family protein [Bartonella apis]OLY44751.1 Pyrimidine reductase, riboflavin biosynthesis [Bartonella apis]
MRPFIICHMMTSIDGKIVEDHWSEPYDGSKNDETTISYYDLSDSFKCDAEMLGRVTVQRHFAKQEFNAPHPVRVIDPQPFIGKRETKRLCIVVDRHGRIKYEGDKICGENIIVVLGKKISQAYLEHLRSLGISYVFAGEDGNDLVEAMESLGRFFNMKRIVLQGGGTINGAFLENGLINELSVMIYPGIDGRKAAPSLFDWSPRTDNSATGEKVLATENPAAGQSLELLEAKNAGQGVIALRYKIHHEKNRKQ